MKKVLINKEDFDNIVYPAAARGPVGDFKEARLLGKVLGVLEEQGKKQSKEEGGGYVLKKETATFDFEDEFAEYLLEKRMVPFLEQMQGWAAVRVLYIVEALEAEEEKKRK